MSTVSAVSVCNMALTRLGQVQITTLTENSKAARLCNANLAILRDSFLQDNGPNFALKRETLASSGTDPNHEWTYAYPLPDDCLQVVRTYAEVNRYFDDKYDVEENQILTNETEMNIEYIASIEDYNAWSALAIDTFADRLAAELAYPVTGVVAASKQRWEIYNNKLKIMRGRDRRLGSPKEYIADEWLNARIGIIT